METTQQEEDLIKKPKQCWGVRHSMFLLYFLGFFVSFSLRINLSVAIVAMVKPIHGGRNVSVTEGQCPYPNNSLPNNHQEDQREPNDDSLFDWSASTQGMLLGAFYYGFCLTQLPGGVLSERYGGKFTFGLGIGLSAVVTLFYPWAAKTSVPLFAVLRGLQGFFEGFSVPAFYLLATKWIPEQEKSTLMTIIFSGFTIGMVITLPISGILAKIVGWESIFYATGGFGTLWLIVFMLYASDTPHNHRFISKEELLYIEKSTGIGASKEKPPFPPLKAIFMSLPWWAVTSAQIGNYYGQYTLMSMTPKYLSTIQHYDIDENGFLTALPYVANFIVSLIAAFLADRSITVLGMNKTASRKLFGCIGNCGLGAGLVWLAFVNCDRIMAVVVLCVSMGINAFVYGGHCISYSDISPNFAGTIFGIAHTIANIAGFVSPMIAGAIIEGKETIDSWRIVFLLSGAVCFVCNAIFVIFGSADVQSWNNIKSTSDLGQTNEGFEDDKSVNK